MVVISKWFLPWHLTGDRERLMTSSLRKDSFCLAFPRLRIFGIPHYVEGQFTRGGVSADIVNLELENGQSRIYHKAIFGLVLYCQGASLWELRLLQELFDHPWWGGGGYGTVGRGGPEHEEHVNCLCMRWRYVWSATIIGNNECC